MNKKICILIPVYNEAPNIPEVIRELKLIDKNFHIVVINDGSTDNSAILAKKEGAVVLSNPKNCGSGIAMKKGFRYALIQKYPFVIQIDGDAQHDPKNIHKLIKVLKCKKADMVIGSRYIKKTTYKTPFHRYICIRMLSILFRIFYSFCITDPTSGYRGFNKKALKFLLEYYNDGYPEAFSIASLITNNYKIKEISVVMRPRLRGKSSINIFNGFYYFIKNIIQITIYRFTHEKNAEVG